MTVKKTEVPYGSRPVHIFGPSVRNYEISGFDPQIHMLYVLEDMVIKASHNTLNSLLPNNRYMNLHTLMYIPLENRNKSIVPLK